MSYTSNVVDFPSAVSGMFPCKEKHAQYKVDKKAHDALVRELSAEAATCSGLHTDYEASVAANAAALSQLAQCQAAHTAHTTVTGDFNSRNAEIKACEAANKVVKGKLATNANKKRIYDSARAAAISRNGGIQRSNAGLRRGYEGSLAAWTVRDAAYKTYRLQVSGMARGMGISWTRKVSANSWMQNYTWDQKTQICGMMLRCQTASWHKAKQITCNPVKGLGSSAQVSSSSRVRPGTKATECQAFYNYPYCPTSCPPYKSHPGTKPSTPNYGSMGPMPTPPTYLSVGPKQPCPSPKKKPGSAPACDTGMTIPSTLPTPTCTPPELPPAPIAPTCKISMFSKVGPMWLLLAAGAGGVYWYSKKK